jgi:ABC-type Fe3+-siderophore transport system permease subunit
MVLFKNSLWYPLRSREVKAICSNLSQKEETELSQFTHEAGKSHGTKIGIMAVVLVVLGNHVLPHWSFFPSLAVVMLVAMIIGWLLASPIRRKTKLMLCNTAYAKQMGYSPATLRLFSFQLG